MKRMIVSSDASSASGIDAEIRWIFSAPSGRSHRVDADGLRENLDVRASNEKRRDAERAAKAEHAAKLAALCAAWAEVISTNALR